MANNTRFHSGVLRKLFPKVLDRLNRELGINLPEDTWCEIGIWALPSLVKQEFLAALVECAKHPDPEAAPPDDSMEKHQEYTKKVEADIAAQGKVIAEKNAAIARLDEHGRVNGLVPSDKNIQEITNWIDSSHDLPEQFRGRWTVQVIDLAIKFLTKEGKLEFRKAAPATPVIAPAAEELLPTGEPRLKLGTIPARHHSVIQLRDLDARERATRGRQQGTFASKF